MTARRGALLFALAVAACSPAPSVGPPGPPGAPGPTGAPGEGAPVIAVVDPPTVALGRDAELTVGLSEGVIPDGAALVLDAGEGIVVESAARVSAAGVRARVSIAPTAPLGPRPLAITIDGALTVRGGALAIAPSFTLLEDFPSAPTARTQGSVIWAALAESDPLSPAVALDERWSVGGGVSLAEPAAGRLDLLIDVEAPAAIQPTLRVLDPITRATRALLFGAPIAITPRAPLPITTNGKWGPVTLAAGESALLRVDSAGGEVLSLVARELVGGMPCWVLPASGRGAERISARVDGGAIEVALPDPTALHVVIAAPVARSGVTLTSRATPARVVDEQTAPHVDAASAQALALDATPTLVRAGSDSADEVDAYALTLPANQTATLSLRADAPHTLIAARGGLLTGVVSAPTAEGSQVAIRVGPYSTDGQLLVTVRASARGPYLLSARLAPTR